MHTRFQSVSLAQTSTDPSICRISLNGRVDCSCHIVSGEISEIFESIVRRRIVLGILNWFDGFFYWFLISQFSVWVAQLPRLPRGAPVSLMKFKFRLELCSQHTKYCRLQLWFTFRSRYRYIYLKGNRIKSGNWQTNERCSKSEDLRRDVVQD